MFPTLKTGAVMQYPAKRTLQFNTDAIRFLDGTEQRFRDNPSVLHRWTIQLDLLDESELAALDQFFISNQGRFGSFSFTAPWDGTVYPNCSLAGDTYGLQLRGAGTIICTKLRQEYFKHEVRECSSSPDESCAGVRRVLPFGTLSL